MSWARPRVHAPPIGSYVSRLTSRAQVSSRILVRRSRCQHAGCAERRFDYTRGYEDRSCSSREWAHHQSDTALRVRLPVAGRATFRCLSRFLGPRRGHPAACCSLSRTGLQRCRDEGCSRPGHGDGARLPASGPDERDRREQAANSAQRDSRAQAESGRARESQSVRAETTGRSLTLSLQETSRCSAWTTSAFRLPMSLVLKPSTRRSWCLSDGHAQVGAPTSTLASRREVRRHSTSALPSGVPGFILHSRLTVRRRSKSSIARHLMLVERTMASLVPVLALERPTTPPSPWIPMDTTSKPLLVGLDKPKSVDPAPPSDSVLYAAQKRGVARDVKAFQDRVRSRDRQRHQRLLRRPVCPGLLENRRTVEPSAPRP